ncbi:Chromodomain-helicase-DNA-binding protein 1-like, partial [Chytridiales sp. JEL 0842]
MTHMLDILQDYLDYRRYTYERLDGSIRGEDRTKAVTNFGSEETGAFVFLLSTRAGGVGLNLTAADTVIFVDSDFNPTMDQQAAARAHRIGQTKPVRVIRLLSEGTVEEVIWKRARAKLSLSLKIMKPATDGDANSENNGPPSKPEDIISILRFGLDKLLMDTQKDEPKITIKNRNTPSPSMVKLIDEIANLLQADEDVADAESTLLEETVANGSESIYMYAGKDYKADEAALAKLCAEMKLQKTRVEQDDDTLESLRIAGRLRAAEKKEEQRRKKEERRRKKWEESGYVSYALESVGDDEDEEDEEDAEEVEMDLVLKTGSVVDPIVESGDKAIILHVVDDSGNWPDRGVFAALNKLDPCIGDYYTSSSENDNLHQGDAHLIPIQPLNNHPDVDIRVAIVVAQKRYAGDTGPGKFRFPDLETALQKVAIAAKRSGAVVHLPRIGQGTQNFDWYKTERIIRKCFLLGGVRTIVYYYRRNQPSSSFPPGSAAQTQNATPRTTHELKRKMDGATYSVDSGKKPRTEFEASDVETEVDSDMDEPKRLLSQIKKWNIQRPLPDLFVGQTFKLANISDPKLLQAIERRVVAYGGILKEDAEDATNLEVAYARIRVDAGFRGGTTVMIFVSADTDALCACKILT